MSTQPAPYLPSHRDDLLQYQCKCNSASIDGSTSLHPVEPSSDPNKAGSRMSHPAVHRVTLRKQPLAKTLKQQWLPTSR